MSAKKPNDNGLIWLGIFIGFIATMLLSAVYGWATGGDAAMKANWYDGCLHSEGERGSSYKNAQDECELTVYGPQQGIDY